jgi:hypothetical protein
MQIVLTDSVNLQFGNIISGTIIKNNIEVAEFSLKKFEKSSKYGINNGKISKLFIKDARNNILTCYDRGWDIKPDADAKEIFEKILKEYN